MKGSAIFALAVLGSVAAGCLTMFSAHAQLPKLSITPASDRTVTITWPYTNSGFALQEATNLTMVVWRSSALAPGFNSNSATFSITATATNSPKFFRLSQPADLRGIYVDSNTFPIDSNNTAALTASLCVPGVDGLVLVLSWTNLEPSMGRYRWNDLDDWTSNAMAANINWTVKRSCSDVQIKGVTIAAAGWTDFGGQEFLEDAALG